MSYRALDVDSVRRYVAACAALGQAFPNPAAVRAREVGDGNLNLVFILEDGAGNAVVVKQALPYLRVAGESWPLTRDRMIFETKALRLYNDSVPHYVPEVLHADDEMSLVVMTYLKHHTVVKEILRQGTPVPGLGKAIGTFMATTHFLNSDLHLSGEAKKERQVAFSNPHLCRIQEDFVYTNPFMDSEENRSDGLPDDIVASVRNDVQLKSAILRTKLDYMTNGQTLVHGDLHTGSMMAHEQDVRVIDPEFAFYGPAAYDVGNFFAHLAIAATAFEAHAASARDAERHRSYLLGEIENAWVTYVSTFHELWSREGDRGFAPARYWDFVDGDDVRSRLLDSYLDDILAHTARHAACEILRRLMGIVSTSDLWTIGDPRQRASIETRLVGLARTWLVGDRQHRGIDAILSPVKKAAGTPVDE